MEAQLQGFVELAGKREHKNKAMVTGYNKTKHMLLGLRQRTGGKFEVNLLKLLPTNRDGKKAYKAEGTILACEVSDAKRRKHWALQMAAALNSLLSQILLYRYGMGVPTAQWVVDTLKLPGWRSP